MVRTFIDLINLGFSTSSFFISLIFFTILAIVFAKSIKKNATILYWIFGVLGSVYALPVLLGAFDLDIPYRISSIPILGGIVSELSSASYFIHPVIVIIMYMGALSIKSPYVAKLMSIRKELSIIVGFAVIAHATKRVIYTFPRSWNYFFDNDVALEKSKVVSVLGSNISNFVFVLGIVMTVLFLVLWVTSFDSVRRKMGSVKWKKVQNWSYVLYAMLFIHAVGLYGGSLITSYARERIQQEKVAEAAKSASIVVGDNKSEGAKSAVATADSSKKVEKSSRPKRFDLGEVKVSRKFRSYFNISLYFLVYGSYLFLRLRKSKRDKLRKAPKNS